MRLYLGLTKIDEESRMVFGYASTPALDSQGEIIAREAIEQALPDYMKFANIREMHQPSAVGVAKEADIDEKGLYLAAKVVDDDAWAKVKEGVYKGFSIGGRVTARDPVNRKIITGLDLSEISLVDRPANPEAVIDLFKSEEFSMIDTQAAQTTTGDVAATDPAPAAKIAPTQIWDCGAAGHQHLAKAEAVRCMEIEAARAQVTKIAAPAVEGVARLVAMVAAPAAAPLVATPAASPAKAGPQDRHAALAKGMWAVQSFAALLEEIQYLRESAELEAMIEGDGSDQARRIKEWLAMGCDLLVAVVAEETAELVGEDYESDLVVMADGVTSLSKRHSQAGHATWLEGLLRAIAKAGGDKSERLARAADAIAKAGARHSKADMEHLQKAHDEMVALGATCAKSDEVAMAEPAGDLAKVTAERDAAFTRLDELGKAVAPLVGQIEALQKTVTEQGDLLKRVAEQPAAAKYTLTAVAKDHDGAPADDPTPATPLEAIKKAQQRPFSVTYTGAVIPRN